MDCKKAKTLLIDYADGMLDTEQSLGLKEHLKHCEACAHELYQIQQLYDDVAGVEPSQPASELRDDFYAMLEKEKSLQNKQSKASPGSSFPHTGFMPGLKYAAIFLGLIALGFFGGRLSTSSATSQERLTQMQQEISMLRNNMTVAHLSRPSASQRIQAVHLIGGNRKPDRDMINALIYTLNHDDNINVRLAAASALSDYTEHEFVKESLIHSLHNQEDPIMQITMIQILVQLKDERAIRPLRQIIGNQDNPEMVKQQAREGLQVYL